MSQLSIPWGTRSLGWRALWGQDAHSTLDAARAPGRLPLSYAQQRLWFLDKLEGSSAEYNMRKALRLKGELDCPAFERALNALIARHETLRTRFDEEDGEPSQVIEPAVHLPLVVEDLSALEPAEGERRDWPCVRRPTRP